MFCFQEVFDNFKYNTLIEGKHNIAVSADDGIPVLHKFTGHIGTIGNRQHGITVKLKSTVFLLSRQERQLKNGKIPDEFRIGKASSIAGLGLFRYQFNIFLIVAVDGGSQYPQVAAFEVHIPAPFELGELAFGKGTQVNFNQGIDGHAVILGKGRPGPGW